MLFNSAVFIFCFLPVSFGVFFAVAKRGGVRLAAAWLVLASLFFYGWWNPRYVGLILVSMVFNYAAGAALSRRASKPVLWAAVSANLLLLGYYKYAHFFAVSLTRFTGFSLEIQSVVLPLGISFFTFTQIAYLVDAYKGETREYDPLHYALFVTYFPHLIAGPILHHKELIPQFEDKSTYSPHAERFAAGGTLFAIGLFKKVIFADAAGRLASPVFAAAAHGTAPAFFEAWFGALFYAFQLYFDFSGYSDMALGLSRMIGVELPINFNSPYKAENFIEFWRRWHMTLSRFLRDYLYIPLGGNRSGKFRRYMNLLIVMVLGGLWHGAGWTFVIWGALHGIFLALNHLWNGFRSRLITFLAVTVAWVFFRAENLSGALSLLRSMMGLNGIVLPERYAHALGMKGAYSALWPGIPGILFLIVLWVAAWGAPNSQEIMARRWRLAPQWAWAAGAVFACGLLGLSQVSEFLYFQF